MTRDELKQTLMDKLTTSSVPLSVKELVKGLPKSKKGQPSWPEQAQEILEAEAATARVFRQPSAKNQTLRYWTKDERHHLRERILAVATTPMAVTKLAKEAAQEFKADAKYVEGVVRDLIGEGHLHEHKPKKGASLFGSEPPPAPPAPLTLPANAKKVDALVKSVHTLMKKAGVDAETIFAAVRMKLAEANNLIEKQPLDRNLLPGEISDLDEVILSVVKNEKSVDLANMRQRLPEEYQGEKFDQAVIRLANADKLILQCDLNKEGMPVEQQLKYVRYFDNMMTHALLGDWQ